MFIQLLKAWFGDFSKEEFKKFSLLGLIFSLLIGVYWTLRIFKDTFFQEIIGKEYQPWAKGVSLIIMFPLVIIYSKVLEKVSREKMFYILSLIYGLSLVAFAYFFYDPVIGLDNKVMSLTRIIGWVWYVFVESFGSLMVGALFWAFATDITSPESAKKGFSLVVMIGQVGGILLPFMCKFPSWYNVHSSLMVLACAGFVFLIIPLVKLFLTIMPKDQMVGYAEKGHSHQEEVEPGFLEGLRLLVSQPYLLGIFSVIFFYEMIVTVIDYYFKFMAAAQIPDLALRNAYMSNYASYVNLVTLLCLLFGINNIQRRLGLAFSLGLMPILVGIAVFMFGFNASLTLLFYLMVASKAVNYALNGPSLKQLYIPTTKEVRYKAQAWIESFGGRGSKAAGSGINETHKYFLAAFNGSNWKNVTVLSAADYGSFYHILLSCGFFSFVLIGWFFIAIYLASSYKKAVDSNKVVC